MKTAYYLLKVNSKVDRFQAEDVFKMATVNGAKAYDAESFGTIKQGNKADLVFIKKDQLIPNIDDSNFSTIVHNLLFETKEDQIRHVMIDGKWVMFDRKLLTIDEKVIDENYKNIIDKVYSLKS
ncbi:amidohydrolase family protein [Neobacillus drentensis]|uniref:amidohydrolase family protein n=1 Tax=Neobacillus drentensis TaxID=220684 RepID=UPI002FFE0144